MITTELLKFTIKNAFKKTRYKFTNLPKISYNKKYGVYIHIPFCKTKCKFCPFYKEIYSPQIKKEYLEALKSEILTKDISGKPIWIYIGGGTPNLLNIEELNEIISCLKQKISLPSTGIELLPELVNTDYLVSLKQIGFTKINLGVESLELNVLKSTNRKFVKEEKIEDIIKLALDLGLWVNVDMMVGLPHQTEESFLKDIQKISQIKPSQVTIYPYMVFKNTQATPSMDPKTQHSLIEEAFLVLKDSGYIRKSIWTFSLNSDDIYDSSSDELVCDYIGFGAGAFSTSSKWKIVNPELKAYLKNHKTKNNLVFLSEKTKLTDTSRYFAKMIYDLNCYYDKNLSFFNFIVFLLKLRNYSNKTKLTQKGIYFSHEITRTVVESLPLPIQNKNIVENYKDYMEYIN